MPQLDKVNVSEIVVGHTKVPAVTTVRNLGAWLDANLTMSAHINKTCQLLFIICIILDVLESI